MATKANGNGKSQGKAQGDLLLSKATPWAAARKGDLGCIRAIFPRACLQGHKALHENISPEATCRHCGASADVFARGPVGETVLHVALLSDAPGSDDVATYLIDTFGADLVNADYTTVAQPGDIPSLYEGEAAVHIAIVNRKPEMLSKLIHAGAFLHSRARGQFFQGGKHPRAVDLAELPLSFAVGTGQPEMVRMLIRAGARLRETDTRGRTALHIAVVQNRPSMYLLVLAMSKNRAELEAIADINGRTALDLAASMGRSTCVRKILDSRRSVLWTYGPITMYRYSCSGIDTVTPDGSRVVSVLSRVVAGNHVEVLQRVPVLREMVLIKWMKVGRYAFAGFALIYLINLGLITSGVILHSSDEWRSPRRIINDAVAAVIALFLLVLQITDILSSISNQARTQLKNAATEELLSAPIVQSSGTIRRRSKTFFSRGPSSSGAPRRSDGGKSGALRISDSTRDDPNSNLAAPTRFEQKASRMRGISYTDAPQENLSEGNHENGLTVQLNASSTTLGPNPPRDSDVSIKEGSQVSNPSIGPRVDSLESAAGIMLPSGMPVRPQSDHGQLWMQPKDKVMEEGSSELRKTVQMSIPENEASPSESEQAPRLTSRVRKRKAASNMDRVERVEGRLPWSVKTAIYLEASTDYIQTIDLPRACLILTSMLNLLHFVVLVTYVWSDNVEQFQRYGVVYFDTLVLGALSWFAWVSILYFARASRAWGGLVGVVILCLRDIILFSVIFGVFLAAFSVATFVVVSAAAGAAVLAEDGSAGSPFELMTFGASANRLFEVAWSLMETAYPVPPSIRDTVDDTADSGTASTSAAALRRAGGGEVDILDSSILSYLLVVLFVAFTIVLLLNLIIAMMAGTFTEAQEHAEDLWLIQWAAIVLELESHLPKSLRRHCVIGAEHIEKGDNAFFDYQKVDVVPEEDSGDEGDDRGSEGGSVRRARHPVPGSALQASLPQQKFAQIVRRVSARRGSVDIHGFESGMVS